MDFVDRAIAEGQRAHAWAVENWPSVLSAATDLLVDPWVRFFGLVLIVYVTIRVIASVYSGDMQNSELGPVGVRPHAAQRLDRKTILLPRLLMPMNMDGVHADCRFFYAYIDARGVRRDQLIYTMKNATLAVSPVRLTKVATTVYGQEIPDLATEDVCFPPVDLERIPEGVSATPERTLEYAELHKVIENWREDDEAPLISVHGDTLEEIKDARRQFLTEAATKVHHAREGGFLHRWMNASVAKQRPNVVGSFYIKLEFSHEPWFVLTRHPDRDLKMTAWLTVLTSMFAMLMEIWPRELPNQTAYNNGEPTRQAPANAGRRLPTVRSQ